MVQQILHTLIVDLCRPMCKSLINVEIPKSIFPLWNRIDGAQYKNPAHHLKTLQFMKRKKMCRTVRFFIFFIIVLPAIVTLGPWTSQKCQYCATIKHLSIFSHSDARFLQSSCYQEVFSYNVTTGNDHYLYRKQQAIQIIHFMSFSIFKQPTCSIVILLSVIHSLKQRRYTFLHPLLM